jgi:ubiquinone/menaquinone biosynthesis C-methylase UbiE
LQNTLQHTKEAFDTAALTYDELESRNEILKWMRNIVHRIFLQNFTRGNELLELNSGTGTDAIFLAEHGIKVFATDISEKMVGLIKEKIKRQNAEEMIEAKQCSFSEITAIEKNSFDGVLSNFGGLNCINDFNKLGDDLSLNLRSGGKFIAVVMNKICPWEIFYYSIRFDFKNVFRRLKKEGIDAFLGKEVVRTYYFTPGQFADFFSGQFKVKKIYALGLFTPPPFLIGIYRRFKPLVKLFMGVDEMLKGVFPFNRIGDILFYNIVCSLIRFSALLAHHIRVRWALRSGCLRLS